MYGPGVVVSSIISRAEPECGTHCKKQQQRGMTERIKQQSARSFAKSYLDHFLFVQGGLMASERYKLY